MKASNSANIQNQFKLLQTYINNPQSKMKATDLICRYPELLKMTNKDGETPLLMAVNKHSYEIVEHITKCHPDPDIINYASGIIIRTPLGAALSKNLFHIAQLLVNAGANINASAYINELDYGSSLLNNAIIANNENRIKFLLENKVDIHTADKRGRTPLYVAMYRNNVEIVKLLITNGVDVNLVLASGFTPLSHAIRICRLELAKLLIEAGADVNSEVEGEESLLQLAIKMQNSQMLKLLIDNGAKVDSKDKEQRTEIQNLLATLPKSETEQIITKKSIHTQQMEIYRSLEDIINNKAISIADKIKVCCDAINPVIETGKILHTKTFSTLFAKNTLSSVLTLMHKRLIPQIQNSVDSKQLRDELTNIAGRLKENIQLTNLRTAAANRNKVLATLPIELNPHDEHNAASINAAIQGIKACWYCLLPDFEQSMKDSSLKAEDVQSHFAGLDRLMRTAPSRSDIEGLALEHSYNIQMEATRLVHRLPQKANNSTLLAIMNIVRTLADAKTVFAMRDFLYQTVIGCPVPQMAPENEQIIIKEKESIKKGVFKSKAKTSETKPRTFLSEDDMREINKELAEIKAEENNTLQQLEQLHAPKDNPVNKIPENSAMINS